MELDDEIHKILRNQIGNITKFMTIGFLGRWEPEVDALLRLIIWKVCMRCTFTADISGSIIDKLIFDIYIWATNTMYIFSFVKCIFSYSLFIVFSE